MFVPLSSKFQENPPVHWQLLSVSDLDEYFHLRQSFLNENGKSKKGERLESFMLRLNKIRAYIERGDSNDWKRSVVCGIMFLKKSIAINIQQLRLLVGKCKSSINGSLQQLGYTALPQGREMSQEFLYRVPFFQKDSLELKKWTIRENSQSVQSLSNSQKEAKPLMIPNKTNLFPLPQVKLNSPINAEKINEIVQSSYPCPVKFRYKYIDMLKITPTPIQNEVHI